MRATQQEVSREVRTVGLAARIVHTVCIVVPHIGQGMHRQATHQTHQRLQQTSNIPHPPPRPSLSSTAHVYE